MVQVTGIRANSQFRLAFGSCILELHSLKVYMAVHSMLLVELNAKSRDVFQIVLRLNDPLADVGMLDVKLARFELEMIFGSKDPIELTTIVAVVLKSTSTVEGHWIDRLAAKHRTAKLALVIRLR